MIQLYDYYDQNSRELHHSLQVSGYVTPVVVINDDGFLPKGVASPFAYFCQMEEETDSPPLFYNQLPVLKWWEIIGTGSHADLADKVQKRAKINHYNFNKYLRFIQSVEWLDLQHKLLFIDHYNQYELFMARTYLNEEGKQYEKHYYNQLGKEIICHNFQTGHITLQSQKNMYFLT